MLAEVLGLDRELTELGSALPDADTIKPLKHKKTLHQPLIGLALLRLNKSLGVGFLSHLASDTLSPIIYSIFLAEKLKRKATAKKKRKGWSW